MKLVCKASAFRCICALGLVGCHEFVAPEGATVELHLGDSAIVGEAVALRVLVRDSEGVPANAGTRVTFLATAGGFLSAGSECTVEVVEPAVERAGAHGAAEVRFCGLVPGKVHITAESGPARAVDSVLVVAAPEPPGPPPAVPVRGGS